MDTNRPSSRRAIGISYIPAIDHTCKRCAQVYQSATRHTDYCPACREITRKERAYAAHLKSKSKKGTKS